ncbi:MAG: GIY-YIG nuclease family protein [Candidatus Levybacteria bacterium]|nr:GIY-YIG nuclease family protein [Candidatus Levybacteria bacterium]
MKTYLLKSQKEAINYIQKLATKLGSTPSEKVFYQESGMKLYPLQKLGFPSYGYLVRKAKLTPNKFDKTKYNKEFLLKEFIKMIRKDKSWPTRGELDVKHYGDPSFPASATFYKKFGLVRGIAESILEYIDTKKNYEDVIKICNSVLETTSSRKEEKKDLGYVYIYKNGSRSEYKIGISENPIQRGIQLATLSPEKLKPVHCIKTHYPRIIEKYLHEKLKDKNTNGEWFKLTPTDIKEIKSWDGKIDNF